MPSLSGSHWRDAFLPYRSAQLRLPFAEEQPTGQTVYWGAADGEYVAYLSLGSLALSYPSQCARITGIAE